jgi:hypothetical protein
MKHTICSAVFTAPNCFRTVIRNTGISRFYSVCVKDIYDLEEISRGEAAGSSRENDYDHTFTRVWRVVDRDLIYYQRPYKNVRFQRFERHGRYIIIECFTTYNGMRSMRDTISNDRYNVKDLLFHLLEFHSKQDR